MPTILIVDDEPILRALIRSTLKAIQSDVVEAGSGSEALEAVQRHHPDLIVLDWMMPGISGLDVVRLLRQEPATAGIAILILSARGSAEDRAAMQAFGVEGYMTKPFSPLQLLATVRAILAKRQPP